MADTGPIFEALRAALWSVTPADGWSSEDRELRYDLVQGCLVRWIDDLQRTLSKAEDALQRATVDGCPPQAAADELEQALRNAVAAREKLVAILAQFLGVPSLDRFKDGIRFFPRESRVRSELTARAKAGVNGAGTLLQALIAFDDLTAVGLRNQLEHGISFLPSVTEICWFRIVNLGAITGEPVGSEMSHLMAAGLLDQADLLPETLVAWVATSAREAVDALVQLVGSTSLLVTAIGELAPVSEVYRVPGRPGVLTKMPESA